MNITKEQFIERIQVHAEALKRHKLIEQPFKKIPVNMIISLNSSRANKGKQSVNVKNRSDLW